MKWIFYQALWIIQSQKIGGKSENMFQEQHRHQDTKLRSKNLRKLRTLFTQLHLISASLTFSYNFLLKLLIFIHFKSLNLVKYFSRRNLLCHICCVGENENRANALSLIKSIEWIMFFVHVFWFCWSTTLQQVCRQNNRLLWKQRGAQSGYSWNRKKTKYLIVLNCKKASSVSSRFLCF